MNKQTNIGNTRWFIYLTLAVSIIAILAFATGKNLPDFFQSAETPSVSNIASQATKDIPTQTSVPIPTAKLASTVTLSPSPTQPASPTTTFTLDPASQSDTGWQGEYYNNDRFLEPVTYTRVDSEIIFDWQD